MNGHRRIDERSLAFGRAIAARLADQPDLVATARATLDRWRTTCSPRARATLDEWADVLNGATDGLVAVLTGEDERATRLRQSNPFAGALPERERTAIIRQFQAHDPPSA